MKKYVASLHYSLIVLILTLLFSLNFVAASFSGTITAALGGTGANLNSGAMQDAVKGGAELSQQIAEEGITLLKNQNNALPLTPDADGAFTLNVFGAGSSDKNFVYQGYGSGGGSRKENTRISLYTALRGNGISINEELATKYNGIKTTRSYTQTANDKNIYEASESFYNASLMSSAHNFSHNALIVISRVLGEAYDAPETQTVIHEDGSKATDDARNYLQLSKEEEYMISQVCATFENVIVLLNSTNVMECGFLQNSKIDAALTLYAPGHAGSMAVGSVLTGSVTPSGRTVDTWAYDFKTAATYANAGVHGTPAFGNQGSAGYVDYAEGIYHGYYWYETADAEHYWDDVNNQYGSGYKGVVQYPFGFGLSYTNFEWTVTEVSIEEGSALTADTEIKFTVEVKNTGNYPGMEVVQLYATPQYFEGGIEKPEVKLVAFEKTGLLAPKAVGKVELKTRLFDMASYDVYDANDNGFMGYEAENGTYTLSLRTNAHEVASVKVGGSDDKVPAKFTYNVEEEGGIKFTKDPDTGADIVNRFTTYTNETSKASSTYEEPSLSDESKAYSVDGSDAGCNITYMTRADFKGTFPQDTQKRQMSDEFRKQSYNINSPKVNGDDVMPEKSDTSWKLADLIDAQYDDPRWMEMVRQLSVGDISKMFLGAGWMTIELKDIDKPIYPHADGPSGFNQGVSGGDSGYATNYPCETLVASSWNWRLAYQFGLSVGEEAAASGIAGWYGPACTLHRSPLSGRNFEYYSEDSVLSGIMVAYTIKGAMEKGLCTFVKHFVVADTESFRRGKYTWLTEQALREVYHARKRVRRKSRSSHALGGTRIG